MDAAPVFPEKALAEAGVGGELSILSPKSSAGGHLAATDDELVSVKPMLDRIEDWSTYLAQAVGETGIEDLRKHTRTGRPLGESGFIDRVERLAGKTLRPQKPGPKIEGRGKEGIK